MSRINHNSAIMFFAFTGVLAPHRGRGHGEARETFERPTPAGQRGAGQGPHGVRVAGDAADCGSVWYGALPPADRG
jgi:hypothetical protein